MRNTRERLEAQFGAALDFNPSPFDVDRQSQCPRLALPLLFYDKHIDERLSLKRIVPISPFSTSLRKAVTQALDVIIEENANIPSVDEPSFPTPDVYPETVDNAPVQDAIDIGERYEAHMADFAGVLASMLLLHPTASSWVSSVGLRRMDARRKQKYYAMNEDFKLFSLLPYDEEVSEKNILKEAWDAMNDAERNNLKELSRKYPVLAVWQMFFPLHGGEDVLKSIDNLLLNRDLPTLQCHTRWRGPANVDLPPHPDAITTGWGIPMSSFVQTGLNLSPVKSSLRRSARLSEQIIPKVRENLKKSPTWSDQRHQQWPSVTLPSEVKPIPSDELMAASIIQRAWAHAVETDSSFIILHCGTFERIAFRHRASQTLFISELIDVTNCKDPHYGEIQLGLFCSIIKDALDRTLQLVVCEKQTKTINSRKRKSEAVELPPGIKRPRTRAGVAQESAKKLSYQSKFRRISETSLHRQLLLLRIQHHHFNSSSPASFLRAGSSGTSRKSTYKSSEYLCVTITSTIASGATGDAHRATIELVTSDGQVLTFPDAVIKISFGHAERKRMHHEYDVYQHLKSSGVTGIPHVFGLFEGIESDAVALLMTDVGPCLVGRSPDKKNQWRPVTKSEADAFMEVLKPIHAAGVRHRDIRIENLVLSEDSVPYIIDFDRAVLNASERSRNREFEHLRSVLDGDFTELGVSFGTPSV